MNSTEPTAAANEPAVDQPPIAAVEAAAPLVPPPGLHPAGFETIHDKPKKLWHNGTLVYTSGALMLLFFWLLFGDFALQMRERSVGSIVTAMLDTWKTSNLTISILLSMIPTAIGMVLGPVVSYRSDRLRSRWGRRIPFLLIPTPIAAGAMLGLAFTPHLAAALRQAVPGLSEQASLLTCFAVCWTAFEVAVIVSNAVFNGLINDTVPREVIGRFYALFRAVSLVDGMIFNWYVVGHVKQHFTIIFVWVAAVFGVGFMLMCLNVKEGDYPENASAGNDHRAGGFFAAVGVYFRECFSLPHYRWVFAMFTIAGLAAAPINAWAFKYALALNPDEVGAWASNGTGFGRYRLGYGGILTLTYFFSLTLAYPLGSLVDRFSAMRMSIAAMTLYALSVGLGALFIHDGPTFGWALLAHGVLSGTYFTCSASLAQVLLPRSRFSQFQSAGGLVAQVVNLGWAALLGMMLDWTHSNYRITFVWSFVFSTAAVAMLVLMYRRYTAMGGPNGYEAPLAGGPPARPPGGFEVPPPPRH